MDPTQENNKGKSQDVSWDLSSVGRWKALGSDPRKRKDPQDLYITPKNLELREVMIKAEN